MPEEGVRIDSSLIPDWAWNWACRLFQKKVDEELAKPEVKAEYEEWLAEWRKSQAEAEAAAAAEEDEEEVEDNEFLTVYLHEFGKEFQND